MNIHQELDRFNQSYIDALDEILTDETNILESEIFSKLKQPPYQLIKPFAQDNQFLLFQQHFILYNALYKLRDIWFNQNKAHIEIGLARVSISKQITNSEALTKLDTLRSYYLNWDNLLNTDEAQVETLLDNFWQQISIKPLVDKSDVEKAFVILEINSDANANEIKQAYKGLCLKHHPDRGGDQTKITEINWAWSILKP
ncbi:DNA-J related domain-containing protein [Catenovulum maritimum]|uniref:J domain-containing protein n=1 Tax=Catenovulum maritimum TaxID=1513271 RepID=A0A0J8GRL0_9ALTE|nr:DNA-J related domain-containing protein [Catenovulum maritimum]KMT65347.1 hypothetical protein XM47_09985 [Catenovulum maritimum]